MNPIKLPSTASRKRPVLAPVRSRAWLAPKLSLGAHGAFDGQQRKHFGYHFLARGIPRKFRICRTTSASLLMYT